MIKGIFRYPGGKAKKHIREKILGRFPNKFSEFRDAMVGGGGIFFAIDKSIKRWVNDVDPYLMSVYLALKDRSDKFIESCREIKPHSADDKLVSIKLGGKQIHNDRLKAQFDYFATNDKCDQALRYFFINRTVWAGRVNYGMESRMYFSNHNGWNIVNTNRLEEAAEYLKDTKITCGDYKEVLTSPGNDVVIYVDPPYYLNTRLATNSQLYRFNFTGADHKRLADIIKQCKHRVVISYDDNQYIRNLYKGFNFGRGIGLTHSRAEKWIYCGTSSVMSDNQKSTKRSGKELIITNY